MYVGVSYLQREMGVRRRESHLVCVGAARARRPVQSETPSFCKRGDQRLRESRSVLKSIRARARGWERGTSQTFRVLIRAGPLLRLSPRLSLEGRPQATGQSVRRFGCGWCGDQTEAPVRARVHGRPWDVGRSAKDDGKGREALWALGSPIVARQARGYWRGCGMALGAA